MGDHFVVAVVNTMAVVLLLGHLQVLQDVISDL